MSSQVTQGATYGTFAEHPSHGAPFPSQATVAEDFAGRAAAGMNAVRLYEPPPRWLADLAHTHGLRLLVGLPWPQHHAVLHNPWMLDNITLTMQAEVQELAGHPAVAMYAIGNEIPPDMIRWYGADAVSAFLQRLCLAVKATDPGALVTYANYPSSEYLGVGAPCIDVPPFNVYLEDTATFKKYLDRLQNIAVAKPLLITELGLDSKAHGADMQAEFFGEQLPVAFAAGVAGTFAFAWTDEWWRGGKAVTDWDFGLVTRDREPKPALEAVAVAYARLPFPPDLPWPSVTLAVCTHNNAATLADTCGALSKLDYAAGQLEVLFVDDGSTDATPALLEACQRSIPASRVLTLRDNCGLSCARNAALNASSADVIAYTDGDALPDAHWLRYLALRFMEQPGSNASWAAVGGQSLAPLGYGTVADSLAYAPGGAAHVLLNDTAADHIAGCNSAFRREALAAVGGWDPFFRIAGDDVDVDSVGAVGFHGSAVVWHRRRPTLAGFLKQQAGYGDAEAKVEFRQPARFTEDGYMQWGGSVWGRAPFQQRLRVAPTYSCGAAWWLWLCRQAAVWAAAILAVAALTRWRRGAAVSALVLAACLGLLAAVAWQQAARTVRDKMPHLSAAGRLRGVGPLAAATLLQPFARDWGNVVFWTTAPRSTPLGLHSVLVPRRIWKRSVLHTNTTGGLAGDVLPAVEQAVRAAGGGAAVLARGPADSQLDFALRDSHLAGATAHVLVEYFNKKKTQVYIEVWPYFTGTALAWLTILASAAGIAWLDSQPRAARVLAALTAVLALCLWAGCCRAETLFLRGYQDALAQLADAAHLPAAGPAPLQIVAT
ncbi:hypothetical protein ABPG75_000205 [Micractinium tetrahymenae]